MLKIAFLVVVVLLAFLVWRWNSVSRGADERDQQLIAVIDPLGKKIDAGKPVTKQEVAVIAARPEIRFILFAALRHMKHPELLPDTYSSSADQGASALAYWLMHPNEFGKAPDSIEFVKKTGRIIGGDFVEFGVYRYRMAQDHPASKDGWLLGVVGPLPSANSEPYAELPMAFARGTDDKDGSTKPDDLVDWWVTTLAAKGIKSEGSPRK